MSDTHHVPSLHVRRSIGVAIKAYIAAAGASATASLSGGSKEFGGGNTMAAFSSRGPLLPSDRSTGDLLKPDVLPAPAAATYRLYVHGWQTDGASAVYTLFDWLVPSTAAGNLTATTSTSSATVGGTADVTASWSGLTAGTKYLGRLAYSDGSGEIGSTIVSINPWIR
jgi:hypothetical protein